MKQKRSKCKPITKKELAWAEKVQKVFNENPNKSGLWLFSASGTLELMKSPPDGEEMGCGSDSCGVNPDNIVFTFRGIRNDGGDW